MTLYRGGRRTLVEPKEETVPINWRRGLLRVWMLMSAAWIMGWAIYSILYAMSDGFKTAGDFLSIPVVFFGPPIALLLFGLATAWAFRGFKMDAEPSGE
ncbi:MAG TPA: hypothetical protein VF913_04085 [Xanthobacteraceae bacterium]